MSAGLPSAVLREPHPDGSQWPCGHPRTEANTQSVGEAGTRCRICRRRIALASKARKSGMTPEPLTFTEAEKVGSELHDRWQTLAGSPPLGRDDLAWVDIVQFVIRRARDVAEARSETTGGN